MHVPEVRWLTGDKGREHWRVEEVVIQAKKQKKADVVARKEQAEAEKQQWRREMMLGTRDVVFSGWLSSKKVEDLRDIAYLLALPEEGTKDALIEVHPELQQNPRFTGLFSRHGQRQTAPTNKNINIAPQPQGPVAGPSSHPAMTLNQAAAGPSEASPLSYHSYLRAHTICWYISLFFIYTSETTRNVPIPPLQPNLPSPLVSVNNPTIPPSSNPSYNYHR
jgi:hypothetical protein